jgi:hypothetical protein
MSGFRQILLAAAATVAVTGASVVSSEAAEAHGQGRHERTTTMVVRVADESNRRHHPATALACPQQQNGEFDCEINAIKKDVNRFGLAVFKLKASVTYRVFALVANPDPAWACPGLVIGGDELYLSNTFEGKPAALPTFAKLVIPRPNPLDCVAVTVDVDTGETLPGPPGLFVCAHLPDSSDCIGDRFDGPDADGVIRLPVDDTLLYDLGVFIANTGWPCPFIIGDGTELHFGVFPNNTTYTPAELLAGVTLTLHHPDPSECPPPLPTAVVNVVVDTGEPLPGPPGLFVCAHLPDSSDCIGNLFQTPDPDGVIRLPVDDTLLYDLGPFIANTGWPCPLIGEDGNEYHFGIPTTDNTYTPAELFAGVTLTLHHPDPSECPPPLPTAVVNVVVDTGEPLPGPPGLFVCAHLPDSSDCIGDRFDGPDADGVIRLPVDDALLYDLGVFITNTGWPCPLISGDGTEFHFGVAPNNTTYTLAELFAGVTLTLHHPDPSECTP